MKKITLAAATLAVAALFNAPPLLADDMHANSETGMDMEMHAGPSIMVGQLELSGAFTRAMPPAAKAGGGFVTIVNHGTEADRLISASSPAAPVVELHEMKMENDVMVMREKKGGIEIPAGQTVTLAPGGLHIMFMQVPEPFAEGKPVPVSLTFEKAGTVDIMLSVAPLGATEMSHDH